MFDQAANTREAIRKRRARIEQIDRILSAPACDRGSRYALRLIEEKQHQELVVADLEGTLAASAAPASIARPALTKVQNHGRFCLEVVNEIRKVKKLHQENGYAVAETHTNHPDWNVWKVLEALSKDDIELFHHPNQWGPVVGYAQGLLAKYHGKARATIHDWCKRARRTQLKVS